MAFVQLSITSRFDRVTSIWNRANPQLRDLAVYEAGKPIEETARELNVAPRDIIKLAFERKPARPVSKSDRGNARGDRISAALSR